MFIQFAQLHFPPAANRDLSSPSRFSFVFLRRRFAVLVRVRKFRFAARKSCENRATERRGKLSASFSFRAELTWLPLNIRILQPSYLSTQFPRRDRSLPPISRNIGGNDRFRVKDEKRNSWIVDCELLTSLSGLFSNHCNHRRYENIIFFSTIKMFQHYFEWSRIASKIIYITEILEKDFFL